MEGGQTLPTRAVLHPLAYHCSLRGQFDTRATNRGADGPRHACVAGSSELAPTPWCDTLGVVAGPRAMASQLSAPRRHEAQDVHAIDPSRVRTLAVRATP